MDPRVREHARIVAEHSASLQPGDNVVIDAHPVAEDLVTALFETCADVGANPLAVSQRTGTRFRRAYLRNHDGEFELPSHEMALFEEMDVYIAIRGDANVTETADIDPVTSREYDTARKPLLDERLSKRWVLTQYPAGANAQLAEMSTEGYENFVWDAVNKDWDEQGEFQAQMVELLDPAEEVRIVSGDTTDVTMSVAGNTTINDTGKHNLPGGEVFTAPVPDSVEGEVLFDKPLYHQGREVTGVHLVFEDGEVVEHSAEKNEEVLTEVLNADDGARRLGELGIGMNRDIDRFTYNMLFDEKMGDTVHMAVGRAYEANVGEDNEQNESAVHVDMIVDMSEDSFIEVDGDVVQRDGTFRFEDGF
ncbi:aminopeptidase [Haloarchaeobius iranensis]|uniref:Aminopeptidase n=1 Tax=Haloarchaeobius iranensis TaxID=996166 RepID=A0A1G9SLV4_9EURY|nr:aminopeptidase [Haloarchaeobius iranensis]SDM36468.1 aminopeptidase [Haloarchaeobius iranensis]